MFIADDGRTWFAWPAIAPCPDAVKHWTALRAAAATASAVHRSGAALSPSPNKPGCNVHLLSPPNGTGPG